MTIKGVSKRDLLALLVESKETLELARSTVIRLKLGISLITIAYLFLLLVVLS